MKKLVFVLGVTFLLLAGCETKLYSVLIKNDSKEGKTVSYTYNGLLKELAPTKSEVYEVKAYTQPPVNVKDGDGKASIEMVRDGDTFTFIDAEQIVFKVVNLRPFEITIKADNYIWDTKKKSIELSVQPLEEIPNEERPDELFIYTVKPKFTTESDYPVVFDWNITDLEELDSHGKPKKKLSLVIR